MQGSCAVHGASQRVSRSAITVKGTEMAVRKTQTLAAELVEKETVRRMSLFINSVRNDLDVTRMTSGLMMI